MAEDIPFTKQMRQATREIHAVSDALINAKLAFASSDNSVWAEGLLVFYEIFHFLEEAMVRLKGTSVGEYNFEELKRTEAFQKDLEFYLGKNWSKNYSPRESVTKYLIHLQNIEKSNPILLVAYIYHLYMGLLSGGQILSQKRVLMNKLLPFGQENAEGNAVASFGEYKIKDIKKKIVETTNNIALVLDDKTKKLLMEESKTVFILNNSLVKTVNGTTYVLMKKVILFLAVIIGVVLILRVFLKL